MKRSGTKKHLLVKKAGEISPAFDVYVTSGPRRFPDNYKKVKYNLQIYFSNRPSVLSKMCPSRSDRLPVELSLISRLLAVHGPSMLKESCDHEHQ